MLIGKLKSYVCEREKEMKRASDDVIDEMEREKWIEVKNTHAYYENRNI